jgi:2'-5' RNA ligase
MARIATDVVLLPDETMADRAIEANGRLIRNERAEIVLDSMRCLPHISLAMGCVAEHDVDEIAALLRCLGRETTVHQLHVVRILAHTNSRGETTQLFEVERVPALQELHQRVMGEMEPFFIPDVTEAMIYDDVVAPTTLDWIRNYRQKASFEHFTPHITIGYGEAALDLSFPIPFQVTRLALCHLGNHCTCRRVLAAADL